MSNPGSESFNPFTESVAGHYFVGREKQLKQFHLSLKGLTAGKPGHIFVAGVHGTGKTSFLYELQRIANEQQLLGVVATLDEDRSAREHLSTIIRTVIEGLEARSSSPSEILNDWDRGAKSLIFQLPRLERVSNQYLRRDFETVRKLATETGTNGIVICIDEGQRIEPSALSTLKNALQPLDKVLLVISLRLVTEAASAETGGRAVLDEKARNAEGDFGASRFFVTGIPMGPFRDEDEVAECVHRRLENNTITFDEAVIRRIAHIAAFIPREVISVCSQTYDYADHEQASVVDVHTLDNAFRQIYREQYRDAITVAENTSDAARTALCGLLRMQRPATADEIVTQSYPTANRAMRPPLTAAVAGELDRLSASAIVVAKSDSRYHFVDPVRAYALKLALEGE